MTEPYKISLFLKYPTGLWRYSLFHLFHVFLSLLLGPDPNIFKDKLWYHCFTCLSWEMLLYQVYICYFIKTNLDSILKNRDITLPAKVCLVKVMVFPVVMYKCESWIIKKAEHWRIDAFELWCWRRLLRVPWTSRRYNQSILMEISPEYSLEGLMLKLKLQCFGHLMRTVDSLTLLFHPHPEALYFLFPFYH